MQEVNSNDFGREIEILITQEDLVEKLDVSRQAVGKWVNDNSIIIKNTKQVPKDNQMKRYRWVYAALPITVIAVLIGIITNAWSPYAPIIILFCCLLVTTCKLLMERGEKNV